MANTTNKDGPKKDKHKQTWVVMVSTIVVLLVIVGIVMIVFQNKDKAPKTGERGTQTPSAAQTQNATSNDGKIAYTGQPSLGRVNAPVRLAEFGDYKCIYCHQFEVDIFPKLKKDFIDTGKVRFYFMNYPIIAQDSVNAANAGEAMFVMYPDHFWDFHQLLYENQGAETDPWVTDDLLLSLAKKVVPNLDVAKFQTALEQGTYVNNIRTDAEMGKAAGVNGTPSVFINGEIVPGESTLDYNALKDYIQKAVNGDKDNGK